MRDRGKRARGREPPPVATLERSGGRRGGGVSAEVNGHIATLRTGNVDARNKAVVAPWSLVQKDDNNKALGAHAILGYLVSMVRMRKPGSPHQPPSALSRWHVWAPAGVAWRAVVPAQFPPTRPHRQMRLLRHPLRALLLLLVLSARGASACDTSGSVIDCHNADLTAVTFEPKKYDSVTFTADASAVMTVPAKFADEVQAAVFQFACAGECKSLVLQGKQFYKVAHERASISITSAGDIMSRTTRSSTSVRPAMSSFRQPGRSSLMAEHSTILQKSSAESQSTGATVRRPIQIRESASATLGRQHRERSSAR